jgi:hypothetical protein
MVGLRIKQVRLRSTSDSFRYGFWRPWDVTSHSPHRTQLDESARLERQARLVFRIRPDGEPPPLDPSLIVLVISSVGRVHSMRYWSQQPCNASFMDPLSLSVSRVAQERKAPSDGIEPFDKPSVEG